MALKDSARIEAAKRQQIEAEKHETERRETEAMHLAESLFALQHPLAEGSVPDDWDARFSTVVNSITPHWRALIAEAKRDLELSHAKWSGFGDDAAAEFAGWLLGGKGNADGADPELLRAAIGGVSNRLRRRGLPTPTSLQQRLDAIEAKQQQAGRPESRSDGSVEGVEYESRDDAISRWRHAPDFRSISIDGTAYSFTASQAACVRIWWEALENGTPDVGDATVLEAVDSAAPPSKVSTLFRASPAWNSIIVPGRTKGSHRLSFPEKPEM